MSLCAPGSKGQIFSVATTFVQDNLLMYDKSVEALETVCSSKKMLF